MTSPHNRGPSYRLGVDIGGTFTDAVLLDEQSGDAIVLKVPSARREPWTAVLRVLQRLETEHGVAPAAIRSFVHGTTLATNTIIERTGARTGLLVTEGFKDLLELGRMRLMDVLDLHAVAPRSLVERRHVAEIGERLLVDGRVRRPLDRDEVRQKSGRLVADGVQALAVCFLHAYRHPEHEAAAGAVVRRAFPDLYVALSSEVWPELREYERAIITVIDAYVGPRMSRYFAALEDGLRAEGLHAPILVTRSNGGIMSARTAQRSAAETLLSGPASGVIGAAHVAAQAGYRKIVGLDMGGTSAEIAIVDGAPLLSTESRVGDFPVVMPAMDVSSIGAGGGSIAWCDAVGVLKVGPQSAGADPGPACLGRGGTEPTVTDAYVELGIVDPGHFLGGEIRLDPAAGRAALERLGRQLSTTARETAEAIVSVATANMYAQFVPLAAKKGIELEEFTLLAYGGAGATHACLFAEEVGLRRVLVPPAPGILCALGALVMDVRSDYVRSLYRRLDELGGAELATSYAELEAQARAWLERERIAVEDVLVERAADMRYVGQGFDIAVPCPPPRDGQVDLAALADAFHARHDALYRHADRAAPAEITTLRLTIVGRTPRPPARRLEPAAETVPTPRGTRQVAYQGQTLTCPAYERTSVRPGHRLVGPCLVDQYDTTTFVTPGFEGRCDPYGNLVLEARR